MKQKKLFFLEIRTIAGLTLPLLLGQVFMTAMSFVDTVMAGRYSTVDLAGVAVGTSIFLPLLLLLTGVIIAVTPLVAHSNGERDYAGVRSNMQQGMMLGCILGTMLMALIWQVDPLLPLLQISPDVAAVSERYLFAISWGLPVIGMYLALRQTGDGLGQTRLAMLASFAGLIINVLANYVLIYGKLGLPSLGGAGCGWASTLSFLIMMLVMAGLLASSTALSRYRLLSLEKWLQPYVLWRIFVLGLPIGLAIFVESSIFAVIALLIAQLGAEIVAGHQITFNFSGLAFMVPYSLSMAITVRVGYGQGHDRPARVRRSVQAGLVMATGLAMLSAISISLFSKQIAGLYTSDPGVQQLATGLLCLMALYQIPDAIQVSCSGALRGLKDTKIPMVLMIISYWGVALPLGYGLGLGGLFDQPQGPQGFWIALTVGLSLSALLQGWRLYKKLGY